jgi:hypothetical protein
MCSTSFCACARYMPCCLLSSWRPNIAHFLSHTWVNALCPVTSCFFAYYSFPGQLSHGQQGAACLHTLRMFHLGSLIIRPPVAWLKSQAVR